MALTPKQEAFVREYLVDLNATAAYQRAGYRARGHAAEANASRLLRNAEVAAAIQSAQQARAVRTEIRQDWVLQRLKSEAESAASDAARVAALRLLGQHLGLFVGEALLKELAEIKKQIDELMRPGP